eukprot:jgi/Chrzof1/10587/Cz05g04140.t1
MPGATANEMSDASYVSSRYVLHKNLTAPGSGGGNSQLRSYSNLSPQAQPSPPASSSSSSMHRKGCSSSGSRAISSSQCTYQDAGGTGSSSNQGSNGPDSLQPIMDKLVDAAVVLVEEGHMKQAIDVLKNGIAVMEEVNKDIPELGELHNQVALLLLFSDNLAQASHHAERALDITQQRFGASHMLTAYRLVRLATIRIAQERFRDAQPLLATAIDMLQHQVQDATLSEAQFYVGLLQLAAAETPADVADTYALLLDPMKSLVGALGGESILVRLALSQHSRFVGGALDRAFSLGEAMFKQHIKLQEIQDPDSPEIGLTAYQLATCYYAHDMLPDAGSMISWSSKVFKQHYPEGHDLIILCKHRLGMICAAGRDTRAGLVLLSDTNDHYKQQDDGHPLRHEAELGLAMVRMKSLEPRLSATERQQQQKQCIDEMRMRLTAMASKLGADHMLVTGGSRYLAQLKVMAGM